MDEMSDAIVEIANLTKSFGGKVIIDDLSLSLKRGTALGLIGPNGAGKSTLIRLLMGTLRPDGGTIHLFGGELRSDWLGIRRRIGFVPDFCQIYPWMSVRQVLRFSKPAYPSWNDDVCSELLDQFRLPSQTRVRHLSLGMRAKLLLLIALAPEPELLVMDEPLSGLDPIARDQFIEGVLQGICRGNRTVLMSSHQLDEISRIADDVAIMNRGRLLVHQRLERLGQSVKQIRAVLLDGRLPQVIPAGAIHQTVKRREWRITLQDASDDVIDLIRTENPVSSVEVFDVSLDEMFREFVHGDDCGAAPKETIAC